MRTALIRTESLSAPAGASGPAPCGNTMPPPLPCSGDSKERGVISDAVWAKADCGDATSAIAADTQTRATTQAGDFQFKSMTRPICRLAATRLSDG